MPPATSALSWNSNYLEDLNSNNKHQSEELSSKIQPRATSDIDLVEIAENTPHSHYAKKHPGAGWAGFRHPLYGGYLDHLKDGARSSGSSNVDGNFRSAGLDENEDNAILDH